MVSSEQLGGEMQRCEVVVEYDPDEVTPDDIEDYFHEATHHVDYANIVFSNTERFDYYE